MVLAALIPLLRIPVWAAKVVVVQPVSAVVVAALVVAFGFTAKATVYRTLPPAGHGVMEPDSLNITVREAVPQTDDEPYLVADRMPEFEGGDIQNFRQWVMMQVRYPAEAQQQKIQGCVVVQFVVERDGSISGFKVMHTPDRLLSEEVVRVLQKAPKWTPGRQDGKLVRVKYTLPVDFRLPDSPDSGSASPAPEANTVDKVTLVGFGPEPKPLGSSASTPSIVVGVQPAKSIDE